MKSPMPLVRRAIAILGVATFAIPTAHGEAGDALGAGTPGVSDAAPGRWEHGAGDLRVSEQTGAFNYDYPIDVPPGRLGTEPSISLSYSSSGSRRGGIAAGWTLGLPEIVRDFGDGRLTSEVWVSGLAAGQRLYQHFEPAPAGHTSYRAQHDASYARYQRSGAQWVVRNTDGSVHRFNEVANLGGAAAPTHRALLTSTTDAFGNVVAYQWQRLDLGEGFHTWRPTTIKYSSNAAAGLTHHAEVEFVWTTAARCGASNLWTGASFDYRSGIKDVDGASRLDSIVTRVRDTPTAAFRNVRTVSLSYDAAAGSCNAMHGPARLLSQIQESARSPSGTITTLPATRFEYGALWQPRTLANGYTLAQSPSGRNGLSFGFAKTSALQLPRLPMTRSMLVDIDGDGLVDRLQIGGAKCRIQWSRNTGDGWVSGGSFNLPTIPWKNPLNPTEICTVSAQQSLVSTPGLEPPGTNCQDLPTYNMYRYIDLDGDALLLRGRPADGIRGGLNDGHRVGARAAA